MDGEWDLVADTMLSEFVELKASILSSAPAPLWKEES